MAYLPDMRRAAIVLLGVALLGACGRFSYPSDGQRIAVEVHGPDHPWPQQRLVLEIGDHAWAFDPNLGGFLAWPYVDGVQSVRIVRAADCAVLASFSAPADSVWVITLTADSEATVTEQTDGMHQLGPGIDETPLSGCP